MGIKITSSGLILACLLAHLYSETPGHREGAGHVWDFGSGLAIYACRGGPGGGAWGKESTLQLRWGPALRMIVGGQRSLLIVSIL